MIYLIYKSEQSNYVCDALSLTMFDCFKRHGCIAISEEEFCLQSNVFSKDDKIIVCISFKTKDAYDKLASINCDKWLFSIDESKSDGALFRTQLEFFERTNTHKIINSYPSKRNIEFLKEHNIEFLTLPICGSKRKIDYSKKDIDVIVSGQIDNSYYPTRSRIFRILRESDKLREKNIVFLHHSGNSGSSASHKFHGKEFLSLLDRCWIGVTCRAGWRDRMVAKYSEFGFSHVLPIGDAPSYIDKDMQNSMLLIDEMMTDNDVVSVIKDALSDKSTLIKRIEKYSSVVESQFDLDQNVKRIVESIQ